MKKGKSTKPPNKKELERILLAKQIGCVCCWMLGVGWVYGEYHHMLSGGRRRGHEYGVCLCQWHHKQYPLQDKTVPETKEMLGPSLMCGSKLFHSHWGSDEQLLEIQNKLLEAAS